MLRAHHLRRGADGLELAYDQTVSGLLEERSITSILAYFDARGLPLVVHSSTPEQPTDEAWRRLPRTVRRAIESDTSTHWVDLGDVARHYGRGTSEEEAIRSAARRYRIEQAPGDVGGV